MQEGEDEAVFLIVIRGMLIRHTLDESIVPGVGPKILDRTQSNVLAPTQAGTLQWHAHVDTQSCMQVKHTQGHISCMRVGVLYTGRRRVGGAYGSGPVG